MISASLYRSLLGSASCVAPARRLSDLMIAPGGFLMMRPSPPVRGGNPKLNANIEPKSAGSYTQSLPPFHPATSRFLFPLLHFSPPETPPLPPTVPPANSSTPVFPRAPESDAEASLVSAAPPQALWKSVGGGIGRSPGRTRKENQSDWAGRCHGNWRLWLYCHSNCCV